MPSATRCEIYGCGTIPFVVYALTAKITKTLCRRHLMELEQRGRRARDMVVVEKRAKEGR